MPPRVALPRCRLAFRTPVVVQSRPHLPSRPCEPLALLLQQQQPSTPPSARTASSSASSARWQARQSRDAYSREAKVAGLKSRAAFKLLEINDKHKLFRRGDTVVDLGYAPGSWSQVALNRTSPGGRVVGIDIIPVQPPRGVSTLQGDFLSPAIRDELRAFVREPLRGRARVRGRIGDGTVTEDQLEEEGRGYLELERSMDQVVDETAERQAGHETGSVDAVLTTTEADEVGEELTQSERDRRDGRAVNVVLSDMSAPWPLVTSTWIRSVSNPYFRMMNTSGMAFRDHAGSMDLCLAALEFAYDTLITGGHFLCKFYQGAEDHALEMRLKKLFEKVHRVKPDSSRKESKEAYLIGLRRRPNVAREDVLSGD